MLLPKRGVLFAGGLAAAIGMPLAFDSSSDAGGSITRMWHNLTSSEAPPASTGISPRGNLQIAPTAPGALPGTAAPDATQAIDPFLAGLDAKPRLEGQPVMDAGEVFRFDVTPAWVMGRWSRATTVSGPPNLQGYRVPLVTGPAESDMAGSLTYYFNDRQQVQRITFVGTTGDPAGIVSLATRRFGFVAVAAPGPGVYLYQIRWHNHPRSELKLRMAEVIRTDVPFQRFDVEMEINLPDVPPSHPLHGELAQSWSPGFNRKSQPS